MKADLVIAYISCQAKRIVYCKQYISVSTISEVVVYLT